MTRTVRQGSGAAGPARPLALLALLVLAAAFTPGCYTTQLGLLRSGLDSLRAQVDTLTVRDSIAYRVLADTRRELGQQRDLLLSTRATSGSSSQELLDEMSRLHGKLDEVMHRFSDFASRTTSLVTPVTAPATVPAAGGTEPSAAAPGAAAVPPAANPAPATGPTPPQAYDQATRDLTEGRYGLAMQGYREFLARFGESDLADQAQYGIAECYFAQAVFDSAATEYARVPVRWPKGDRVPAAMYKLGLCQDKLGRPADAKKTFQDLVRRYPNASEAGLARDRLGLVHR